VSGGTHSDDMAQARRRQCPLHTLSMSTHLHTHTCTHTRTHFGCMQYDYARCAMTLALLSGLERLIVVVVVVNRGPTHSPRGPVPLSGRLPQGTHAESRDKAWVCITSSR
jgi:hypothetical protein